MKSVSIDFVVGCLNLLKEKYNIKDNDIQALVDVLSKIGEIEDVLKKSRPSKTLSLSARLQELYLSIRVHIALNGAGIKTVGQLIKKDPGELLAYKNFGKKSLDEVKLKLGQFGLKLKDDDEPITTS
ncbi:MAG: DNA-directed RNA polymerase subunit alpha C-terminal domain-containing protein [Elusimicrobiota bacterium]